MADTNVDSSSMEDTKPASQLKENVDDTIRGVTNAGVFFSTRFESFLRRITFNC